ncbi:FG-GAP repeat domain-containing protein [Phnomibacter ginsenosidimutans]|uniref:VCBS repeat-containing protein n=1 Tax=Phnomibacter ginsenosidimutans TaxID=2676868 RepID=A0A6I6G4A1_9BACT|nr:VCBS repeat-containing protein [Phnomibacter ginsenosidimutans]QGW27426.1 hypothetical protein GLV81_04335 [Phnomibacter ginsenosidimutans]
MTISKKNGLELSMFFVLLFSTGCREGSVKRFTQLQSNETGITFNNIIEETADLNVLNYTYFYNGAGVAIGDVNNDSLPDIVFTGNMVSNKLYLNKGNMSFEDITTQSGIGKAQGWCTGVTLGRH